MSGVNNDADQAWLWVKTSSLGDVVHACYAIQDLHTAGIAVDWVVERAYAPVAEMHPGVRRVLAVDFRRWLAHPLQLHSREGWRKLRDQLTPPYGCVVDAQSLLKSAWMTRYCSRHTGSKSVGLDWSSAREPLASVMYTQRLNIPRGAHAVHRLRTLAAAAQGLSAPASSTAESGIESQRSGPTSGRVWLLHGASDVRKTLPPMQWHNLAQRLSDSGVEMSATWGSDWERAVAEPLANRVEIHPWQNLQLLTQQLLKADAFIGVDSGLAHLAAALGIPGVTLYPSSDPALTATLGLRQRHISRDQIDALDEQQLQKLILENLEAVRGT